MGKQPAEESITKRDLIRVFWRSLRLMGSFSFERMQGLGFAYVMLPILRKLYPNKEDLSSAVKRHLEFFNTAPWVSTFIFGATIALEEKHAKNKEGGEPAAIHAVKMGLMGPLAGIGDSMFWGTLRIVSAGVGASLAIQGHLAGLFLYILLFNIPHYIVRYRALFIGYNTGTAFLSNALGSGVIQKITYGASIVSLMTIGGMTVSLVNFDIPEISFHLQPIIPSVLPLAYTMLMYYLIKRKQVKPMYLVYGTLLAGIGATSIGFM